MKILAEIIPCLHRKQLNFNYSQLINHSKSLHQTHAICLVSEIALNKNFNQGELYSYLFFSVPLGDRGPQPFWHQGPVPWRTDFPWTGAGGILLNDASTLYLLCTLFLLLLHPLHFRSSGLRY